MIATLSLHYAGARRTVKLAVGAAMGLLQGTCLGFYE
jgi:hypothetical protein